MQAYKRDEMISVTDLLKGFKMTLDKNLDQIINRYES